MFKQHEVLPRTIGKCLGLFRCEALSYLLTYIPKNKDIEKKSQWKKLAQNQT